MSHMLLTSGQGPQRTQSALSGATATGASVSAASVQASVNHGRQHELPHADSAASGSRAAAAAACGVVNNCSSAAVLGMAPVPVTSVAPEVQAVADACSLASAVASAPVGSSVQQQPACVEEAPHAAAPSYAGSSTSSSSGEHEEQHAPRAAQTAADSSTCGQVRLCCL